MTDIPKIIHIDGKRVVFESYTTQEQREKVLMSYATEKAEKFAAARKNPLFQEIKNYLRACKIDIFNDPDNAHLRRTRRSES